MWKVTLLRLSSLGVRRAVSCSTRQVNCCCEPTEGSHDGPSANLQHERREAAYLGVEDIEGSSTGDQVKKGDISLIFMSPESMITGCRWREMFRSAVYKENFACRALLSLMRHIVWINGKQSFHNGQVKT